MKPCLDDSCDGSHCTICGGHFIDFYQTARTTCTTCADLEPDQQLEMRRVTQARISKHFAEREAAEEQVLGVNTAELIRCGYFEGFTPLTEQYQPLLAGCNVEFRLRSEAEEDPSFKQLIPYVIVERHGLVLSYYRGEGQGEARLRGERSIGIGGHINPCDLAAGVIGSMANRPEFLNDWYVNGMLRELHEELRFTYRPDEWDMPIVGLINEDQTEVGKVHLGVVHILHLDFGAKVSAREADILDTNWNTWRILQRECVGFERWSQICMDSIQTVTNPTRTKVLRAKQVGAPKHV